MNDQPLPAKVKLLTDVECGKCGCVCLYGTPPPTVAVCDCDCHDTARAWWGIKPWRK